MLFPLCSLSRFSSVSVVFDLNASLNDVAPFSSILFTVVLMRIEDWVVGGCCFFCVHFSDRVL